MLSTQRVNRAALPQLRKQGRGLLVWVSSSSSAGGTPPYLAPYFAAKAGMDAMAVVYARELTRWGIETSIIVPARPLAVPIISRIRVRRPTGRVSRNMKRVPMPGSESRSRRRSPRSCRRRPMRSSVADTIVKVVDTPFGKRPFRVHVDPTQDGADVAFAVIDRVRNEMLHRVGFPDVLHPRDNG